MNDGLIWIFIVSLLVWTYWTFVDINDRRYLTDLQKYRYEEAALIMLLVLACITVCELIIVGSIDDLGLRSQYQILIILTINLFLVFLFRNRERENNKKIYATQRKNFNLPLKKVVEFKEHLNKETEIDLNYYHIEPVMKKNDLTIDRVKLAPHTRSEYNDLFRKELKKRFKPHLVYMHLIAYYNEKGAKYGLNRVDYDKFVEKSKTKSRGAAEKMITSLFLKLVDKKIPIRISQLLQYADDRKYLKHYIYFLMGLSSSRYTPSAVLYAIFHLLNHKDFKNG